MTLPAPLVPANVDLRDFPCMMIDIPRLFGSEFNATNDDAAWRAGMTLWLKSFHQTPAASIPDDEGAQTRLVELGSDIKKWRRIKAIALRGWVKCSDGRLYHRVVAEKVLEAWIEKIGQRKSSAAGNAKRSQQNFDPTPFDDVIEVAAEMLKALNPNSRTLSRRIIRNSRPTPVGDPDGIPVGATYGSPDSLLSGPQGKRREGKGNKIDNIPPSSTPCEGEGDFGFEEFWNLFPKDGLPSRKSALEAWIELTAAERVQATSAIPALKSAKPTTRQLSPVTYLREKRFAAASTSRPLGTPMIEVERVSAQGDAWEGWWRATKGRGAPWSNGKWHFTTEWPPPPLDANVTA